MSKAEGGLASRWLAMKLTVDQNDFAVYRRYSRRPIPCVCPESPSTKKPKCAEAFRLSKKNWRQPTLAEAIQPLPSARLRLTAEFGMGSGRTTALWPPKIFKEHYVLPENYTQRHRAFSV